MPNSCYNQILFSGEESNVKKVKALFIEMSKKEAESNHGQIPDFIKHIQDGFFCDIDAYELDDQISYNTRWTPNTDNVVLIAKHYGVGFEHLFQELGDNIYGKAIFDVEDDEATIFTLDNSDFSQFEYLDEKDVYLFRGEEFESDYDILDTLFKEKFNQSY